MGRYVNVVARPECLAQINELYAKAFVCEVRNPALAGFFLGRGLRQAPQRPSPVSL